MKADDEAFGWAVLAIALWGVVMVAGRVAGGVVGTRD